MPEPPAYPITTVAPSAANGILTDASESSPVRVGENSSRSERLKVVVSADSQGEVCVTLAGELDVATVPALSRTLAEISHTKLDRLLIDLRSVEFIDSTGLAAIIGAQRVAQANGHHLELRRGSRQVQGLFVLTGLVNRFTFED